MVDQLSSGLLDNTPEDIFQVFFPQEQNLEAWVWVNLISLCCKKWVQNVFLKPLS